MSKRFGRNQKRKMVDALTLLQGEVYRFEGAYKMADGLSKRQGELLRLQHESLELVARVLGKHFYGLPAIQHRVDQHQRNYRLPKQIPLEDFMRTTSHEEFSDMVSMAVHQLEAISVRADLDALKDNVHIKMETPDGRVSYAVSGSAWHQLKRDKKRMEREFYQMIAHEMACFIAQRETA